MMKRTIIALCLCLNVVGIAFAQMPLCLGDNYYQKRMVKVFEALKDQKLDKVAKYWQDMKEKAAEDGSIEPLKPIAQQMSPMWELSEAMMMNTREGHGKLTNIVPYNPWGAYLQLKKACSTPLNREIADRFLSHKNLKMSVDGIKADIEKNLVDTVRKINTESAYDQLVEMLFDYNDMATIEKERELVAYNVIKHSGELSECQRYLDKYENLNPTHHFTIEWKRDSLAFEQMGKSAAACKAYLAAYPSSQFNGTVTQMLHRYAFDEMAPSVDACKEYVRLYPESEFVDTVKTLEIDYAFRDAKRNDNIAAYNKFINDYPKSPYQNEAIQLLQQTVIKQYFKPTITLDALHRFNSAADELKYVDKTQIRSLFRNLVFMPTSAFMKGCDGLLGMVTTATSPDMLQDEEVMIFNDQGLLVRHYSASEGINDRYHYGFDPEKGFVLLSKTTASGKVVTYVTKWNELGEILEVAGNDGSIINYARDIDYMKRVMHYKGRSVVRTDYYDNEFKLDKSVLSGNMTLSYEYNLDGDRMAVFKHRGKAVTDSTIYEYGYTDQGAGGRIWKRKNQSNNGTMQPTRYRQYRKTIDKIFGNSYNAYAIDWAAAPQEADSAAVAALVEDLDRTLSTRRMQEEYQRQAQAASSTQQAASTSFTEAAVSQSRPVEAIPSTPEPASQNVVAAAPIAHETVQKPKIEEEKTIKFTIQEDDKPLSKEDLLLKLITDMVLVDGGIFVMGATSEQDDDAWELEFPAHQVKLSSFYLCKYEVTQELWEAVMGYNPSKCQGRNLPVDMVSWDDCQKFIEKLKDITGIQFRLPTEAEWEYAARGGNKSARCKYAGSIEAGDVAWYNQNSEDTSHPVGRKMPNELGLFDMSGNVWEWCADWQNFYSDDIQSNPIGDYPSQGRIQRGGCWKQDASLCRVSFRGVCAPALRSQDSGLRLAATKLSK